MGNIRNLLEKMEQDRTQIEHDLRRMEFQADRDSIRYGLHGVTLRVSPFVVTALDKLAHRHGLSRHELLTNILTEGIQEAIDGTFSPYEDGEDMKQTFLADVEKTARDALK